MEIFVDIYKNYISADKNLRENAENFINNILNRNDPQDISFLLESLLSVDKSQENNFNSYSSEFFHSIKLFIAMILKKIFESCIVEENYLAYRNHIVNIKFDIIKIILNLNSDTKTLNFLILTLEYLIVQFKEDFNHSEICGLIFDFYSHSKTNNLTDPTFRSLYIFFKVFKIVSSLNRNEENTKNSFLLNLIEDFCMMLKSFEEIIFSQNQANIPLENMRSQQVEYVIKYINLFFKIFKHSVNFMNKHNRMTIMNKTYEFLYFILFKLNPSLIDKNLFDAIFIANKILLKYISYVARVDLKIIKNFSELFYEYISNNQFYSCINIIIRANYSNYGEYSEKEKKFLTNIIDFFKELMQLYTNDNWGDLIFFKECYSEDSIKISDYLEQEFFTKQRYENLVYFIIKNCMFFTHADIEIFNNDIEEFYIWYDNLNPMFDLREKAGLLARIIYDRNKSHLKELFENLEKQLLQLCEKENPEYFGYNYPSCITPDELNLKCGLLYFFESLCFVYYNKHRDYDLWINKILFSHFDLLKKKKGEIFSKFIVIRILLKIIDFKEISSFKELIFNNMYQVFMLPIDQNISINNNIMKFSEELLLLKFAAIDFFFSYFEDIFTQNFPEGFLANFIREICYLFRHVNSPIIHNKLIKTSLNVLNVFKEEEISVAFNEIFPIIKDVWLSNYDNYTLNANKSNIIKRNMISISVLRKNLFQLISIFVKKIGIFFDNNFNYFQFVYEIIGYSLTTKNAESEFIFTEGLRLILLIQDEFYNINRSRDFDLGYAKDLTVYLGSNANNNTLKENKVHYSIYNFNCFESYLKLYDFLGILLDTLFYSDEYFIVIIKIIEQFISLIFIKEIKDYIFSDNTNIISKIINLISNLFNKHIKTFYQPIFNFLEFCLYIFNSIKCDNNVNHYFARVNEFNIFIFNLINNFQTEFQNSDFNSLNPSENDETMFAVLLGTIQISNRLIFINFQNKFFDLLFYRKILNFIEIIIKNIELNRRLNVLNKRIIFNLLINLEKISNLIIQYFPQSHDYDYGLITHILESIKQTQMFFKENNTSNYLDKFTHTQNHWLYFFEKIGSNTQFYDLTVNEESIKFYWNEKFQNTNYNENDLGEINYEIKYAVLVNDSLYKTDNSKDEEEVEINDESKNNDFFN